MNDVVTFVCDLFSLLIRMRLLYYIRAAFFRVNNSSGIRSIISLHCQPLCSVKPVICCGLDVWVMLFFHSISSYFLVRTVRCGLCSVLIDFVPAQAFIYLLWTTLKPFTFCNQYGTVFCNSFRVVNCILFNVKSVDFVYNLSRQI